MARTGVTTQHSRTLQGKVFFNDLPSGFAIYANLLLPKEFERHSWKIVFLVLSMHGPYLKGITIYLGMVKVKSTLTKKQRAHKQIKYVSGTTLIKP